MSENSEVQESKPFSIFAIKPGIIPNVNLWVMRDTFKHLAELIFMSLHLPDPVDYTLKPVKWDVFYDDKGEYVKRLKISFTLEFKPTPEDES